MWTDFCRKGSSQISEIFFKSIQNFICNISDTFEDRSNKVIDSVFAKDSSFYTRLQNYKIKNERIN